MGSKKKYDANADIRKNGPQNYLLLQAANASKYGSLSALDGLAARKFSRPLDITNTPTAPMQSDLFRMNEKGEVLDYWGNSAFDDNRTTIGSIDTLGDTRARNEPIVVKALNGITKAVGTAATTWLDGTLGLALGAIEGLGGLIFDPLGKGRWQAFNSGFYNNEISVALRNFNNWMEEALPNYKTKDEQENPWSLSNMCSTNTIFNDFLKVIGFSVGAYYSGGAWNKVLGLLTKAGTFSNTAARTVGSVVQGFNEARIEAGNLYDENVRELTATLLDAYQKASGEIQSQTEALNEMPDSREKRNKLALLQLLQSELDTRYELEVNNVKDRAEKAAQADMYMNAAYLPFLDAWMYGRLYLRASRMKNTLSKAVTEATEETGELAGKKAAKAVAKKKAIDEVAEQLALKEGLLSSIEDTAEGYKAKLVGKKKAALKGFAKSSGEYAEEVNQGLFSSFSSSYYSPDSPDAYYQALTDEDYKLKTNDFRTALTEGIVNSWGNPQLHMEGLMGFINGFIGMPTFGKVNNSDENTVLGKGKPIGLSGGFFGELKYYNRRNKEALEAVEVMNKTRRKLQDKSDDASNFITRMLTFTNAMNGYDDDDDKFEFKNASDNDLFNAIDAFSRSGRLDHLKQLVKDGFGDPSQFTEEQLLDIAKTAGENDWKNPDGTSMADSEEGQQKMREELKKQQQDTLDAIDRYEKSLEEVRRVSNNSLTSDLTSELAWLNWKVGLFEERYKGIKSDNEELFKNMTEALTALRDLYSEALDESVTDDELKNERERIQQELTNPDLTKLEREDLLEELQAVNGGINARTEISNIRTLLKFIEQLQKAKNPLELASMIASLPLLMNWLNTSKGIELIDGKFTPTTNKSWKDFYEKFDDKLGISYELFSKAMDELLDSAKLAVATRDFNLRYMEFASDPIKLIDNREKIDKKTKKELDAKTKAKGVDRLNNMEVSEIVEGLRNGNIDIEEAKKAMEDMDFESIEGLKNAKEKLEEAEKISKAYDDAIQKLEEQHQQGVIDDPTYNSAIQAIEESLTSADSVEDLLDPQGEAFLNPSNISTLGIEGMDLLSIEAQVEMQRRQAAVQSAINQINQEAISAVEATQDMPKTLDIEDLPGLSDEGSVLNGSTGHDAVDRPKSENIREEKKQEEQSQIVSKATVNLIVTSAVLAVNTNPEDEKNLIKVVTALGPIIDNLINSGISNQVLGSTIKETQGYMALKAISGEENANKILNQYVILRKQNNDAIEQSKQLEVLQPQDVEIDAPTPEITIDEINNQIANENNRDLSEEGNTLPPPILNYWKPTVTELPTHKERGNATPYWTLAKDMKKPNGDPRYTQLQLDRMKAVGEHLTASGAYALINSGKVKPGDEIHFVTDRELNEKAGETVILMVWTDPTTNTRHIVGDVISKNDPVAQRQVGLLPFIEKAEQLLNNDKTDNRIVELSGTTKVKLIMVGKVMYTPKNDTHTLNEIHGDLEFKLGVAVTDGSMPTMKMTSRSRKQGQSEEELSILPPLNGKNGLPFLLMPTGSATKHYVAVPFFMPKYSEQTKDSALGRAITDILKRIAEGKNNDDAVKLKNELAELISVAKNKTGHPEIHINYDGDNVKVHIKPVGAAHLITLYNGNKNNERMVESIQSKLYGTPFQINRKYINREYKGQSYNRMIGELARTNVAIGETHTRSDWFTINPIGENGELKKGSKIESIKKNPNAVTPASANGAPVGSVAITIGDTTLHVDPNDNWSVWYNGKKYNGGPNTNKVRARAYGVVNNKDMTKPYDTQWGYYNPVTHQFESKPALKPKSKEDKWIDWTVGSETKYRINTTTWLILDAEGNQYDGPNANMMRASTYGMIHNLDMKKPYETPWGVYNPLDKSFKNEEVKQPEEAAPTQELKKAPQELKKLESKKEELPLKATKNTPEELLLKAKDAGILNTKAKKAVWEALSTEQQLKMVDAIGPKQKQLMQGLLGAFNQSDNTFDESKLGCSVDLFLNKKALFSKVGTRKYGKKWNLAKELARILKMLPQLTSSELLKIQKGLIKITDSKNPGLAYGMFQLGIITISEVAAQGTLYHEAFHSVFHTLMSDVERQKIMDAASQLYGQDKTLLQLEEELAEDFRKYVQFREAQEAEMRDKYANKPLLGRIMRFFKNLLNWCKRLKGKEPYINKIFKDIYNGKYAERKVQQYDGETRFKYEDFTPEMVDILRRAPRDSEGRLLAPNGKPSNLTERQYVHVRTKAFKEWFGDWQNDPQNASKVVDENGEPLVVYRIDTSDFPIFRKDKLNSTRLDFFGMGFYFSNDLESVNKSYPEPGRKARAFFLNIREYDKYEYDEVEINPESEISKDRIITFENADDYFYKEYIVRNSNQIKSATDNVGTYSRENNDIRYSRVGITELLDLINEDNRVIKKTRRLMEVAKKMVPKGNWTRDKQGNRYGIISNIGYAYEGDAYDAIPNDIREAVEVTEIRGKYYIQYNPQYALAKIRYLTQDMQEMQDRIEYLKEYNDSFPLDRALSDMALATLEGLDFALLISDIRQYHSDKLMYSNLSQEDKDYLQQRGITLEEYNLMSDFEKLVLFECRA